MIALLIVSVWIIVGIFLYYVIEPYFRFRLNMCLADDKIDREMARLFCSVGWPIAIFIHPFIRYVVFPTYQYLVKLEERVDAYWESPPTNLTAEPIIDAAKSGYRNIEMK